MPCTYRTYIPLYLFGKLTTIFISCGREEKDHLCWHCTDKTHHVLGHKFTVDEYRNGKLTNEERDQLYLITYLPPEQSDLEQLSNEF